MSANSLHSLDFTSRQLIHPAKSPLVRGTQEYFLSPPYTPPLGGAGGGWGLGGWKGLIVKPQSLTGFDVKLTPMGTAVSLQELL